MVKEWCATSQRQCHDRSLVKHCLMRRIYQKQRYSPFKMLCLSNNSILLDNRTVWFTSIIGIIHCMICLYDRFLQFFRHHFCIFTTHFFFIYSLMLCFIFVSSSTVRHVQFLYRKYKGQDCCFSRCWWIFQVYVLRKLCAICDQVPDLPHNLDS